MSRAALVLCDGPPTPQACRFPCLVGTMPGPACVQRPGLARNALPPRPVSAQYRVFCRAFPQRSSGAALGDLTPLYREFRRTVP